MSVSTTTVQRYCLDCGYRLDNLPSRACPECGRLFDPLDDLTTSARGRIGFVGRWAVGQFSLAASPCPWIRPASWIAALAATLYSTLRLGEVVPALIGLCLAYLAIGLGYLPKRLLRRQMVKKHGLPRALLELDRVAVRRAHLLFLGTAAVIVLRMPFLIMFLVSWPALNRVAIYEWEVRPAVDPRPSNTVVGIMPVTYIEAGFGGVQFHLPFGATLTYDASEALDAPKGAFSRWSTVTPEYEQFRANILGRPY